MNILTELKNELGYANVTNQYIELAARTFQVDHGNDNLQERAGMVGLSIATLPEDYLKRIANGYIIGVHSCVEHFLVQLFFVKHFSLKKASEFPVFSEGFSLL